MKQISTLTIENFCDGPWKIFRDASNQIVPIASGPEFEGYLVFNQSAKIYGQIRFSCSHDPSEQIALGNLIKTCNQSTFDLLPKVLHTGISDSIPFYITELPSGESIRNFFNSKGAIPPETAVLVLLEFVRSLINTPSEFPNQLAFHPQSIWLCRSKNNPKLQFGDINQLAHPNPLQHNLRLCSDLLRFLAEDNKKHEFQDLCSFISNEATSYQQVEEKLLNYTNNNPAANFWMGYNEPDCILEKVTRATFAAADEESVIIEAAKKHAWPMIVSLSVVVMAFIITMIVMFKPIKPANVELSESKTIQVISRTTNPNHLAETKSPTFSSRASNSTPSQTKRINVKSTTQTSAVANDTTQVLEPVEIDPNSITPELRSILAETGLFDDILAQPVYDWMVEEIKEEETQSRQKIAEQHALTHLENASIIAKQRNELFDAVSIELAVLKIAPNSFESRIRLHDYLTNIKNNVTGLDLDPTSKKVLYEASNQNALAREILILHLNQ